MTLVKICDFYDYRVEFANNNVQLINCVDEVFNFENIDDALLSKEFLITYEQQKVDMFGDGSNLWREEIKILKKIKTLNK